MQSVTYAPVEESEAATPAKYPSHTSVRGSVAVETKVQGKIPRKKTISTSNLMQLGFVGNFVERIKKSRRHVAKAAGVRKLVPIIS